MNEAMPPNRWSELGECAKLSDPELFFPKGYRSNEDKEQVEQAKKICQGCKMAEYCLDWALEAGENDGIWGNTTPDERRKITRGSVRRQRFAS